MTDRILPLSLVAALASPAVACGVCGCSIHTDWASQGLWTGTGFRMDLRYDYFKQDQLRSGTRSLDRSGFALPAEVEVQQQTLNRTLTLGLDWNPSEDWGLSLAVPTLHRTHETLAEGDVEVSASRHVGVGDLRLVGRYQGFEVEHAVGVQFGVKLPTGRRDEHFGAGPQAGERVDRGLQSGTGTTDLILGLFTFRSLGDAWGAFAQAQLQAAAGSCEGFRPGNAFTFVTGIRHQGGQGFTPQLQLNVRTEKRETGAQADEANSGSTLAYLSPGLTVALGRRASASVFLQIPVYQRVSGLQIEPKYLASAALHYRF